MLALFAAGLIVLFSSCHREQEKVYLIPDDAVWVFHVDLGSIWGKGDFDHIDQISFIKFIRQAFRDDKSGADIINSLIDDPNSCGLDLKGDIFLFTAGEKGDVGAFGVLVNDANKFKDFLSDLSNKAQADIDFSSEGNYTLGFYGKTGYCWDDSKAYIISADSKNKAREVADKLMSLQESNSLAHNADFNTFLAGNNDLGVFMNTNNILGLLDKSDLDNAPVDLNQYKNTFFCLALNFENGRIRTSCSFLGMEKNQMDFIFSDNFNKNLLNYLPQTALAGMTLSCNMNSIFNLLVRSGEVNLDEELTSGYTIGDVVKCLSGNIAASFSDLEYNNDWEYRFTIVAEINNARPFRQFLENADVPHDGDNYDLGIDGINVCISENTLMITNETSALNAFSRGGTGNGIAKIASKAQKGNYLYVDLDVNNYPSTLTNQIDQGFVSLIGGFFKDAEFKMTSPTSAELVIDLQNSDKNSLDFTLHYIDDNLLRLQRFLD